MKLLRALTLVAGSLLLSSSLAFALTTGSITGHVKDSAGHSIADATVTIASGSYTAKTTTNGAGFYAFDGVPVDTYTVSVQKAGFEARSVPGVTTVQDESTVQDVVLQTVLKTIAQSTARSSTSLVQPGETADQVVVNQQMLENITGTPMTVEQSQVLRALPGFTPNASGAPEIRGGPLNDLGYEMEGVDTKEPVLGLFTNNGALAGVQQLVVSTGAFDVASGNTNEGTINEVVKQGTNPGFANIALFKDAGYYYDGFAAEAGDATPSGNFTWYVAYHGVRDANVVGSGQFEPLAVGATSNVQVNEGVMNVFYRWGKNNSDQLQFFGETGYNVYDYNWLLDPSKTPYASDNRLV